MTVNRSKARECGGKQQHPTKTGAVRHLAAMAKAGTPHWRIDIYRCQHCRKWHVGHKPKPKRNRR